MTTAGKWMPAEPDEEMIAAGCRAKYGKSWDGPADKAPNEPMRTVWRDYARVFYRAMYAVAPASPGPEGEWQTVPKEPTDEMLEALMGSPWIVDVAYEGENRSRKVTTEHRNQRYVVDGWQAMLAAAPAPPGSEAPVTDEVRKVLEDALAAAEYHQGRATLAEHVIAESLPHIWAGIHHEAHSDALTKAGADLDAARALLARWK